MRKLYGRHLKERKAVDFLGKKKIFFIISSHPLPGRTGHDGSDTMQEESSAIELQP